jgi:hypothetical protein
VATAGPAPAGPGLGPGVPIGLAPAQPAEPGPAPGVPTAGAMTAGLATAGVLAPGVLSPRWSRRARLIAGWAILLIPLLGVVVLLTILKPFVDAAGGCGGG